VERSQSAGFEDPDELRDVPPAQLWRDVLQHDPCVDQVERVIVEEAQIVACVDVIRAAVAMAVERAGALDHRRGHVDPIDTGEIACEDLGHPADPTAEVEAALAIDRQADLVELRHEGLDFLDAGAEEMVHLPPVAAHLREAENTPKRIGTTERVPVLLKLVEERDLHGFYGIQGDGIIRASWLWRPRRDRTAA
jgi:hypothetical protein